MIRSGISPTVNALSTIMLVGSCVLLFVMMTVQKNFFND
jgi:ABC-type spermidine/putrescine transport system permease subunit II